MTNYKKSQVSMEFMFIVGFSLLLFIPVLVIYGTERAEITESINSNQANEIIKKVIDSSETVYYMGEPSKMTIRAYIPTNIESIQITDNEIIIFIKHGQSTSEIVGYSEINMTGSIDIRPGVHRIVVESVGDRVQISSE